MCHIHGSSLTKSPIKLIGELKQTTVYLFGITLGKEVYIQKEGGWAGIEYLRQIRRKYICLDC